MEREWQRAFRDERKEKATAPPAEELMEQEKPPPYREVPATWTAGIYPILDERPQRVNLEIVEGQFKGKVIYRPRKDEDGEKEAAQYSEREREWMYSRPERAREKRESKESLTWELEPYKRMGTETGIWAEY